MGERHKGQAGGWMDRRREGAHETGCEGVRGGLKDGRLVGSSNGREGERERQWRSTDRLDASKK